METKAMVIAIDGLREQVEKGHYLNAHFRAFELAYHCWQEHIRQNAVAGAAQANSPGGAVLDNDRDGRRPTKMS